jgi:tRNA threonylcarbamoyladenosine biosynthesis protein TsaB
VKSKFLIIDTSSRLCSVAVAYGSEIIWSGSAIDEKGFCHAEKLHVLIDDSLKDVFGSKYSSIREIDAIAIAEGPGSYTGLRIGSAAAKGLALPLNIPLIAYSSLAVLAHAAKAKISKEVRADAFWSAMDAKRLEVYSSFFDQDLVRISQDKPLVLDEQPIPQEWLEYSNIWASGDGVEKALEYWPNLKDAKIKYAEARDALFLVQSAWNSKDFVSIVNWVPNYLKIFRPGKAKLGLPKIR